MKMMKTAFGFSNVNTIIGFMLSWGVWVALEKTVMAWGWVDVSDGFIITCIFTVVSYIRMYMLNKLQLKILKNKGKLL